jgi:hypothetical protein
MKDAAHPSANICSGIHEENEKKRRKPLTIWYPTLTCRQPRCGAYHLYHFSQTEKKRDDMLDYAMRKFAFSRSLLINPRRNPIVETV